MGQYIYFPYMRPTLYLNLYLSKCYTIFYLVSVSSYLDFASFFTTSNNTVICILIHILFSVTFSSRLFIISGVFESTFEHFFMFNISIKYSRSILLICMQCMRFPINYNLKNLDQSKKQSMFTNLIFEFYFWVCWLFIVLIEHFYFFYTTDKVWGVRILKGRHDICYLQFVTNYLPIVVRKLI